MFYFERYCTVISFIDETEFYSHKKLDYHSRVENIQGYMLKSRNLTYGRINYIMFYLDDGPWRKNIFFFILHTLSYYVKVILCHLNSPISLNCLFFIWPPFQKSHFESLTIKEVHKILVSSQNELWNLWNGPLARSFHSLENWNVRNIFKGPKRGDLTLMSNSIIHFLIKQLSQSTNTNPEKILFFMESCQQFLYFDCTKEIFVCCSIQRTQGQNSKYDRLKYNSKNLILPRVTHLID